MSASGLLQMLDHPTVNAAVFFPRPDPGYRAPAGAEDLDIEVEPGVTVAVRYHPHPDSPERLPTILHFHGNGEIVGDYDDAAPAFHGTGASLYCADYRGYGRSTGQPTVKALIEDAHLVLDAVLAHMADRGCTGPLVVMGRSLGSAPAIELAARRSESLAGLIIESGFAQTAPLLALFGVNIEGLAEAEIDAADNEDKMAEVNLPLLMLHAERDVLLPPWHAERNFERAATSRKRLTVIPFADHNTIMAFGGEHYWGGITEFLGDIGA